MTTPATSHAPAPKAAAGVHDILGIGIGPFNLGLAALTEHLGELDAVFLDQRPEFRWHHGMMLHDATIQVPFMADLVTMADPTSPYSFLNWLKVTGRLYPFFIRENFHPLRREYDAYCRWVADQLTSLRWGERVETVTYDEGEDVFFVTSEGPDGRIVRAARNIVLGVGTSPVIPEQLRGLEGPIRHSARYLDDRAEIVQGRSIAVVGSGQSAAEIYLDLLEAQAEHGYRLDWVTRSPRFFPMEDTKLTLEMTSPEYTRHFHGLPEAQRYHLLREQRALYKGISADTIAAIHERLYSNSVGGPLNTRLLSCTAVTGAGWDGERNLFRVGLEHQETHETGELEADQLILATGYAPTATDFLSPVEGLIRRDSAGRFAVTLEHSVDTLGGRIFVQNADEHTHSVIAPDLGMGPWRNARILREITGRELYPVEEKVAFQSFGLGAAGLSTAAGLTTEASASAEKGGR